MFVCWQQQDTSAHWVQERVCAWNGVEPLLATLSLHYLPLLHWPTHRRICQETNAILETAWLFARQQSLSWYPRNSRCVTCGWRTGRLADEDSNCDFCNNTAVCDQCHYLVGGLRRCLQCEVSTQHCEARIVTFDRFQDHVLDRVDALQLCGKYCCVQSARRWSELVLALLHRERHVSATTPLTTTRVTERFLSSRLRVGRCDAQIPQEPPSGFLSEREDS